MTGVIGLHHGGACTFPSFTITTSLLLALGSTIRAQRTADSLVLRIQRCDTACGVHFHHIASLQGCNGKSAGSHDRVTAYVYPNLSESP
ncbi:hypothetical protein F5141DRAFT_1113567 [Pisolithus sp. B1]|nr:hypothetical protein F5141DRAFT_1113567 [Pisolithus sp. B1]